MTGCAVSARRGCNQESGRPLSPAGTGITRFRGLAPTVAWYDACFPHHPMLSTIRRALLPALVLLVGLGIGKTARAGGKVDWSEYLEPPGAQQRPLKKEAVAQPAPVASAPKAKKPSRAPAKKRAESRAKAKRPPARSGRRK